MRRGRMVAAVLLLAVALVAGAAVAPGLIDRVIHAKRYATSGSGRLAPDAYVAAARRVTARGDHVARLVLPRGDASVIVATGSTLIYLDPPTARVLDVAPAPRGDRPRAIDAAQPVAGVIARARPSGGGEALTRLDWPTARSPDWTVWFGGADAAVKVADDSGGAAAVPARRSGGAAALVRRWSDDDRLGAAAQLAVLVAALALAAAALAVLRRTVRIARRADLPPT